MESCKGKACLWIAILLCIIISLQSAPVFAGPPPGAPRSSDPEAWAGLTVNAKERIKNGEIVIANQRAQLEEGGQALIQAATIFNVGIEQAYTIVKQTEKQYEFLEKCYKSTLVERNDNEDRVDFEVRVLTLSIKYRVNHHYDDSRYRVWWSLDPDYDNDIIRLDGFWQLYYIDDGHTLARFGTKLVVRNFIPKALQDSMTRRDLPNSLEAYRKRVESGGTYKKKGVR